MRKTRVPKHVYIVADEAGISLWNKGTGVALDENGNILNGGGQRKPTAADIIRILALVEIQETFLLKELKDTMKLKKLIASLKPE